MTRPVTLPTCTCGERFERITLPRNHDRPAVTFLRCTACGVEDEHVVETLPEMEAA